MPTATAPGWQAVVLKEMPTDVAYYLYRSGYNADPVGGTFIGSEQSILGATGPPLNAWTHLAFTYDGITERLFVNGVQVSSKARTGPVQTSTGPLRIGGDSIWGEYFLGLIDEVRVYNRALSATEIQTDMKTPL